MKNSVKKNLKKLFIEFLISSIIVLGIFVYFILKKDNYKFDKNRDKIIYSPSGDYYITLRYDFLSRPYIFKDGNLIFETKRPGFNETIDYDFEWQSEHRLYLYIDGDKERYKYDSHIVVIP